MSGAAVGQARTVRQGLAIFHNWPQASALAAAVFSPGLLRDTVASRRALRRSLRILGTEPIRLGDVAALPRGTPARVTGRIAKARWKVLSHIWSKSEMNRHNVRLLVEEGHDFFLTDGTATTLLVMAADGYLMGGPGEVLAAQDQVEVFGFVDRVIDDGSSTGSRHPRGEPPAVALRSGDDLPLVVRRVTPRQ